MPFVELGVSFSLHPVEVELGGASISLETGFTAVASAAVEDLPSKRLPGPVNGLNLATFFAGSSSATERRIGVTY